MKDQTPIIIIGAGYSGLVIAALCAKAGWPVLVLEGHSLPGGCASFFQRGHSRFDVGATTLSGMEHQGPLWRLYQDFDLKTELIHQKVGMNIHLNGRVLHRYSHHQQWIDELQKHFPKLKLESSWNHWEKTSKSAWQSLSSLQGMPPYEFRDLVSLARSFNLLNLSLVPELLQTTYQQLHRSEKNDPEYLALINQQLLISSQSTSKEVNALIGGLGLTYPSDTYYPMGGMAAIARELVGLIRKFGGEVLFRHKVEQILCSSRGFQVKTQRDKIFQTPLLVSTLPLWNHLSIGPIETVNDVDYQSSLQAPAWGAMTAYFTVKTSTPIDVLYHQIHTQDLQESYFFSFSHPEDRTRSRESYQTVTVSTHSSDASAIPQKDSLEYKELKEQFAQKVRALFQKSFSGNGIEEISEIECGTPRTFEHYTGRYLGRVGGLPHRGLTGLLKFPSFKTRIPGYYRLGDTVFPGQGIVGVTAGAYFLYHHLLEVMNENLY